jgi:hypothetical protein
VSARQGVELRAAPDRALALLALRPVSAGRVSLVKEVVEQE